MQELDYQYCYDEAWNALIDLKGYMEWLRNNNPESYEKKAHWLTGFYNFMKASEEMIANMNSSLDIEFQRGVEKGQQLAIEYDFQQQLIRWFNKHQRYTCTDVILSNFTQRFGLTIDHTKEKIRTESVQRAKQLYPELF